MPLEIEPPVRLAAYRTSLTTWVNGTKHKFRRPHMPLPVAALDRPDGHEARLRRGRVRRVTVVSSFDAAAGAPRHAAVNACLFPLCAVDWCAVTTIEGIGSTRKGLHPVQERMTEMHGSQCGFCTPGIVMAMYALFRTTPDLGVATLEEHMDGNLCRCTGYRRSSTPADRSAPMPIAAVRRRRRLRRRRLRQRLRRRRLPRAPTTTAAARGGGRGGGRRACRPTAGVDGDVVSDGAGKAAVYRTPYSETAAAAAEPGSSELRAAARRCGGGGGAAVAVGGSHHPRRAAAAAPGVPGGVIVVGNTEVGIESRYKGRATDSFLCPTAVRSSPRARMATTA